MKKEAKLITQILILAAAIFLFTLSFSITALAADDKETIDIYALDEKYSDVLEIPGNLRTSYKIPISGKLSDYTCTIDGDTVTISSDLKVKPNPKTVYYVNEEKEYIYYDYGITDVTLKSKKGSAVYKYKFNLVSYTSYYTDQIIDEYIAKNIKSSMSDEEKIDAICRFPAGYDYSPYYSSCTSMVIYGGGDCWASTDAIIRVCDRLGIEAWSRNGNKDPGAGSGHMNAMVLLNGNYYELEAGFVGNAPRLYEYRLRTCLFSYRYRDDNIEVYQYDGKPGFTKLTIPEKIDGTTVAYIGDKFITFNSKVKSIVLPSTIEEIGASAFYNCEALESINIPAKVSKIGMSAFNNCKKLTINVDGNNKYYAADNSTGILYSKDKKTLICAFNLKNDTVTIPNGVEYISDCAFYNLSIKKVYFPKTLVNIGYQAFTFTNLYDFDIVLPKSLKGIGYGAFYSCGAKSITIRNPKCVINNTTENNLCDLEDGKTLFASGWSDGDPVIIYGEKGSTAEQYVKKYESGYNVNYKFKQLCNSYLDTGKHSYGKYVVTSPATTSAAGSKYASCTECGKKNTVKIPKIDTVKLSKTSYVYDKKVKKPSVVVTASDSSKITSYTVTYDENAKKVGKYKVKVKFKGDYSGKVTLYFKINPKSTTLSSVTASSKGFKVKWKKQSTQTTGYQIQYSTDKNFKKNNKTVTVSKNSTTSKKISKLKAKKKYYVRVRTYKTVDGKNYYSSWSKAKSVKTKK